MVVEVYIDYACPRCARLYATEERKMSPDLISAGKNSINIPGSSRQKPSLFPAAAELANAAGEVKLYSVVRAAFLKLRKVGRTVT